MKYKDIYILRQVINNGIIYFGKDKTINKKRTAEFFCPYCSEAWRTQVHLVKAGYTKSCGCWQAGLASMIVKHGKDNVIQFTKDFKGRIK